MPEHVDANAPWVPQDPMTPRCVVRLLAIGHGLPLPTEEDCDFILWERTSFPLGSFAEWVEAADAALYAHAQGGRSWLI